VWLSWGSMWLNNGRMSAQLRQNIAHFERSAVQLNRGGMNGEESSAKIECRLFMLECGSAEKKCTVAFCWDGA
jgi:hypothetical protein